MTWQNGHGHNDDAIEDDNGKYNDSNAQARPPCGLWKAGHSQDCLPQCLWLPRACDGRRPSVWFLPSGGCKLIDDHCPLSIREQIACTAAVAVPELQCVLVGSGGEDLQSRTGFSPGMHTWQ